MATEITYNGPVLFPFTLGTQAGLTIDGHYYKLHNNANKITFPDQIYIVQMIQEGYLVETAKWDIEYLPILEREVYA